MDLSFHVLTTSDYPFFAKDITEKYVLWSPKRSVGVYAVLNYMRSLGSCFDLSSVRIGSRTTEMW